MLQAVPTSFGPFFLLRILLGMLESCVAPILILIISMFYKKEEQVCLCSISWLVDVVFTFWHVGKENIVVLCDGLCDISR